MLRKTKFRYGDHIERRGWVVNIPTSYLGGPEFNLEPEDSLSRLKDFMVSLVPRDKCLDSILN
jgi:hypothetical protein